MKVYHSITQQLEEFTPISKGTVTMYVCGLTPYDFTHIGHARTYVAFDSLKRYLVHRGFKVNHIQNITDVDDKIIKRCKETAQDPKRLTQDIHADAIMQFGRLGITPANHYPKVTEHIREIIEFVQELIKKGYAYETKTGVYYSVSKFKQYGKLSKQNLDEVHAGSRKEVDETKQAPEDFALWKKTKGEIIEFDSPWGKGRPGWHIECSAMARKYAPHGLDIHGGARDLMFPHHENEIAQSEALMPLFVKYWMHTGFLTVEGEKMSKSLGNFTTIADALSRFEPNALRMFFLLTHYRSPVDFNPEAIEAAGESVERVFNAQGLVGEALSKKDEANGTFREESDAHIAQMYSALDNDFDTPNALAALFNLIRITNGHVSKQTVDRKQLGKIMIEYQNIISILGLIEKTENLGKYEKGIETIAHSLAIKSSDAKNMLEMIIEKREEARKNKNYKESDRIRDELKSIGISLEDKQGGKKWKLN